MTNRHFQQRVFDLYKTHVKELHSLGIHGDEIATTSLPGPVVSTLTDRDTSLFPGGYVSILVAYSSPWIDLCSPDPLIASISRQVLNIEVAYANFCGVRSIIVPGPRADGQPKHVAQYARALQETFLVASRVNIIVHMPMYREPGLEETEPTMSQLLGSGSTASAVETHDEIDLFSAWDSWHTIRSVCNYNIRLYVGVCLL